MFLRAIVAGSLVCLLGAAAALAHYSQNPTSQSYARSTREFADVVHGAAVRKVQDSPVAKKWDTERTQAFTHRSEVAETFREVQNLRHARQESQRRSHPALDELFQSKETEDLPPLATSQLDPVTGSIAWTEELALSEYDPVRVKIDALFSERARANGQVNHDQYAEIRTGLDAMRAILQQRLEDKKVTPQKWTDANQFIKQLKAEPKEF